MDSGSSQQKTPPGSRCGVAGSRRKVGCSPSPWSTAAGGQALFSASLGRPGASSHDSYSSQSGASAPIRVCNWNQAYSITLVKSKLRLKPSCLARIGVFSHRLIRDSLFSSQSRLTTSSSSSGYANPCLAARQRPARDISSRMASMTVTVSAGVLEGKPRMLC